MRKTGTINASQGYIYDWHSAKFMMEEEGVAGAVKFCFFPNFGDNHLVLEKDSLPVFPMALTWALVCIANQFYSGELRVLLEVNPWAKMLWAMLWNTSLSVLSFIFLPFVTSQFSSLFSWVFISSQYHLCNFILYLLQSLVQCLLEYEFRKISGSVSPAEALGSPRVH